MKKDFSAVRLLAFDLDGTLLPPDKRLTERTLRALDACRERGLLLAFATGRTELGAKAYLDAVRPDAAVLSYGSHVIVRGRTVFRRFLSPKVATRVMRRAKDASSLRCQTEDGVRLTCGREEIGCLPLDRDAPITRRVDYLSAWDLPQEQARLIAREERCCLSQLCASRWCNFNPYGCSKGSGMRRAFEALGLPFGAGLAFGDEDCDLAFFRVCGMGVAMANGDEATRAKADFIAESCGEDGVAAFLERYILL
ncbi:MAG: HAD family phosphatase [Clostridia bacterium]|nr:HAD family phosphatase [Clostridia bacterium]